MLPSDNQQDDNPPFRHGGLSEKKLKAAGVSFLLADAALFGYGLANNNKDFGAAALFGWTAGLIGTRYGNPKVEKQLQQLEQRLGDYLRQQNIEIPKDPTLEKLQKPGGIIDRAESFLYQYPTQLMNACYAMIGVSFARDGWNKRKAGEKSYMMYSGALLVAGALAGLLIQEKKPDFDHPPQGALQKVASWVQEKPLRLTGMLFTGNQAFLGLDAWKDRRENPANKSYLFKFLAVAGFTFGNIMLGLSSKGEGGGAQLDDAARNQIGAAAARVIAAQPKQVQEQLLEQVADYMASQPYVHKSAPEISALLHGKMEEMTKAAAPADWVKRAGSAGTAPLQPPF